MLKVLHLLNYLGNGGSEKYIFSLAKKLHGKSCRFYIAYSEDGPGRSMFEELGIDLIPLKMNSPFDLKAALQLKKLCRQLSIDVIHTHFLRENYISVLSRIAGNRVGIINTRHMLFENSWPVVLTNRFFTMFNSRIIAVSLHVMERLIMEGISKNRIALIYNGVDTTEWDCSVSSSFRKEAGIPEEDMLITSVSRFSPEKGHDFIIDVIGYMKDNRSVLGLAGKKYRFVLAGSGPLHGAIIEKAKARGLQDDIIFPGYVENVRELLKDSDIFIAHSQNEALGIAILEAMAAGLPVITTDSGGTAEIVDGSGQNGILVRYGDVQGYAEGIALLINDIHLRRKYADNGLKVVRERFSLDKTAAETYNLYELSRKGEKDDR
ncbi:MAG TPA: glycosyltransferase [Clostridiales bacterium]|nr:glycosyltransferase [Clostridiales bacterium]